MMLRVVWESYAACAGRYVYTNFVILVFLALHVTVVSRRRRFAPPPPYQHNVHRPPPPCRIVVGWLCAFATGLALDMVCVHEYPVTASPGAVVITGASTGIGRAAALALVKHTEHTIFCGIRKAIDAESIRAVGNPRLVPLLLDVTNSAHIAAAAETVSQSGLSLVALVNNAGISVTGPVETVPMDKWRRQFDVNFFGLVETTQALLPLLRSGGIPGRIVNIGSIDGDIGNHPLWGPYGASKHALESLTDALRMELRPFSVSVSLIKAGEISTELYNKGGGHYAIPTSAPRSAVQSEVAARLAVSRRIVGGDAAKEAAVAERYREELRSHVEFCEFVGTSWEIPGTELTDHAILHAITSRYPQTRYVLGGGAVAWVLNMLLPDKISDSLMHFVFASEWEAWRSFHGGPLARVMMVVNRCFQW